MRPTGDDLGDKGNQRRISSVSTVWGTRGQLAAAFPPSTINRRPRCLRQCRPGHILSPPLTQKPGASSSPHIPPLPVTHGARCSPRAHATPHLGRDACGAVCLPVKIWFRGHLPYEGLLSLSESLFPFPGCGSLCSLCEVVYLPDIPPLPPPTIQVLKMLMHVMWTILKRMGIPLYLTCLL